MRLFAILIAWTVLAAACTGGSNASPTSEPTTEPTADSSSQADRPWFGIGFRADDNGRLVVFVDPGGPAEQAGIRNEDILTAINDTAINEETLVEVFQGFRPGDVIKVSVLREDESLDFDVTLGVLPENQAESATLSLSPMAGFTFEISETAVTILEVAPNSPAEQSGLQSGDRILNVNYGAASDPEAIGTLLARLLPGDTAALTVERGDSSIELEISIPDISIQNPSSTQPTTTQGLPIELIPYLPDEQVWRVDKLISSGILAQIGVQEGDRILKLNDRTYTFDEIQSILNSTTPNDTFKLTIERNGETVEVEGPGMIVPALLTGAYNAQQAAEPGQPLPVTTSQSAGGPTAAATVGSARIPPTTLPPFLIPRSERPDIGVSVIPVNEELAKQSNLAETTGALVLQVEIASAAMQAGIEAGDIILAVNGEPVDLENSLAARLAVYEVGDTVTLDISRGGTELQLDVGLGSQASREVPSFIRPQETPQGNNTSSENQSGLPFQLPTIVPLPFPTRQSGG